jgi:outer membrane biosynthesis protein TonB
MTYHYAESGFVSPRAIVAGSILALHVAMAYLLATSLAHQMLVLRPTPMLGVVLGPPRNPPPPPPTMEAPRFQPPRIDYVAPVIEIPDPPDSGAAITGPTAPVLPPLAPSTAPTPDPIRLMGKHQLPNTEDFYPADLRRQGIQGATNVRVCVDERGIRQGEPAIEKSSGNDRLDLGAVNVARHGRYARAIQGGGPVANCYRFKIIFEMK